MWGFKGFPTMNAKLARWVLAAEDICFKNAFYSYLFRLGKTYSLPIDSFLYFYIHAIENTNSLSFTI